MGVVGDAAAGVGGAAVGMVVGPVVGVVAMGTGVVPDWAHAPAKTVNSTKTPMR